VQVEAGRDRGAILRMYHNFSIYGNSPIYTLLTAAFSHQNGFHLLFNMFNLWNFGPALMASVGAAEMLAFYAATAVISNIIQRELNPRAVSLGASGMNGEVLLLSMI
jgi:membrane associated rhomboid family serine protease